jgi:hypothetical protein
MAEVMITRRTRLTARRSAMGEATVLALGAAKDGHACGLVPGRGDTMHDYKRSRTSRNSRNASSRPYAGPGRDRLEYFEGDRRPATPGPFRPAVANSHAGALVGPCEAYGPAQAVAGETDLFIADAQKAARIAPCRFSTSETVLTSRFRVDLGPRFRKSLAPAPRPSETSIYHGAQPI